MFPMSVNGYYADQGGPQAWGKEWQATAKPCSLAYLSALNKSGATVYIELYDSASGASGNPRVIQCPPNTLVGWSQLRMRNGVYARAVDAISGGSAIAGDDVLFDGGYMENIV